MSSKNKKASAAATAKAKSNPTNKKGNNTMNTTTQAIKVPFHGASLALINYNGQPYAPMKPIVEGIGLNWKTQHRKLTSEQQRYGMVMMTTPVSGAVSKQEMLCIPLRKFFGWMMSISPSRIKDPAVKEKVIQYQSECDDVLWDYWNKGEAVNPRLSNKADRTPLKNAVNMLIGKTTGMSYSDGYRLVHQRFGVTSVEDLEASKIHEAVEYVHGLILHGELLPKEDVVPAALESAITLNQISELPAGSRMIVTSNNGVATMQNLGQCATVPLDQVMSIRRDFNYLQKLNMEMMERMLVFMGEKSPGILDTPLGS